IDASLSLFPDDSPGTRKAGSKAAAQMLKTDYYLWMAKVENGGNNALNAAKEAVDQVLANPAYQLSNSYANLFETDDSDEIIFALNFAKSEFEGGFAADWLVAIQYLNDKRLVENPVRVGSHQQWVTFSDSFEEFLYERDNDS